MNIPESVLNLLVDPQSGNIFHVSTVARNDFGITPEKLRGTPLSQLFGPDFQEIVATVAQPGRLREITLHPRSTFSFPGPSRAYASLMTIDNRTMLFLCVCRPPQDAAALAA